ncbi:MAG: pyruvate kinase, partial [Nitrospinota bacterium]
GTLEDHSRDIRRIRSVAAQLKRVVMVMIDLPGPKIRIGKLKDEPLILKKGDDVTLTTRETLGTPSRISVSYDRLPESVAKGSVIYLNDGFVQLKVQEVEETEVRCMVVIGGPLISHKGLNLPTVNLMIDAVTERDLELVEFGLQEGVETYCISFVEKADDIVKVKEFARKRGTAVYVVAKIEREEAVRNIDEILEVADAVMVARGDLGVQMPIEEVPAVQKKLITKANLLGRPVITATQMLESMTENVRPTRAEATDVANAILDGTDAVMLSEETAIGRYPVETVRMMARIATSIERERKGVSPSSDLERYFKRGVDHKTVTIEDVVSLNVIETMRALPIRYILTPTHTGSTPRRISRFKPDCWILSFSEYAATHEFMALSYGVYPVLIEDGVENWQDVIIQFLRDAKLAKRNDRVILTEGVSTQQYVGTDSLKVITVV